MEDSEVRIQKCANNRWLKIGDKLIVEFDQALPQYAYVSIDDIIFQILGIPSLTRTGDFKHKLKVLEGVDASTIDSDSYVEIIHISDEELMYRAFDEVHGQSVSDDTTKRQQQGQ